MDMPSEMVSSVMELADNYTPNACDEGANCKKYEEDCLRRADLLTLSEI